MITKFSNTGFSPFLISQVKSYRFAHVYNPSAVELYVAFDGVTTGVTTITGAKPGIIIPTGQNLTVPVPDVINFSSRGYPIWGAFNGAGTYTGVIQEF
jgi:hypothetical protein